MDQTPHIFDLSLDEFTELVRSWGMAGFRARQVFDWIYRRGVIEPSQMTNLSKADRRTLGAKLRFVSGRLNQQQYASDGTQKLLIDWPRPGQGSPGTEGLSSRATPVNRAEHAEEAFDWAFKAESDSVESAGPADSANSATPATPANPPQTSSLHVLETPRTDPKAPATAAAQVPPVSQTECVMIPAVSRDSGKARRTACISSQVGCPVGCRFCASGLGGLEANLSAGQIVEQAWRLAQMPEAGLTVDRPNAQSKHDATTDETAASDASDASEASGNAAAGLTHIVFMGMGEPLANFTQVTRALEILTADWGLGLSPRRVTLSTVGLPAQIRRLAKLDLGITLAVSLHAPTDALRQQIIPSAQRVSIDQLIDAGRDYFDKTGREVTLEYILLGGVNDQADHAEKLAQVARRLRSNVNLIRYNEVAELAYQRPTDADVRRFQALLRERGVNTHLRASRGRDIAAACGQLRHESQRQP